MLVSPIAWNPFFGKRFERVDHEPFVLTDLTMEPTMLQNYLYKYQCNSNMSSYDMQTLNTDLLRHPLFRSHQQYAPHLKNMDKYGTY